MIKTMLQFGGKAALAAVLALGLANSAVAGTVTVYANNQNTGDNWGGGSGSAVGTSGWRYVDASGTGIIGNGATVGINGNLPHDGNGSVYFSGITTGGLFGRNPQAGIEYSTGGVLGLLSEVNALSYNYIRSGGDAPAHFAPTIKLKVTANGKTGYLVWEPVYNGHPTSNPIDLNEWYLGDAIGGKFWASNALGITNGSNTFQDLDYWEGVLGAGAQVVGIYAGIGSGWGGSFTGAVDNITWGFNGEEATTYKFEKAVPEPGSIVMGLIAGGLGLAGAAWRRRRVG